MVKDMVSSKYTFTRLRKANSQFANVCYKMRDTGAHRFDSSIACSTNSLDERLASEIESIVMSAVALAVAADADADGADAEGAEEDDKVEALRRPRDVSARGAASENEDDCDESKNDEARRDNVP